MQASGKRASGVVADFLTVARGVAGTRAISHLNTLVNQYLGPPKYKTLKERDQRIVCTVKLEPESLSLSCLPVYISKCLMNLVINAIFEKIFYTSKQMGKSGTGLGLYIVWSTVQDHQGDIRIVSRDSNTTIELFFPATRDELLFHSESIQVDTLRRKNEKIWLWMMNRC
jgi:signal transduction histidine kinase